MYDHAAAQHIRESGDAFAVSVAVFEGFGEMLRNQQREIRIFGLVFGTFIAMSVDSDDAVGILIHHDSIWVHTEGADIVFEFFCPVDDLAFIQFVRQMREDYGRKFYPDSDVHTVGFGRNVKFMADLLHPFAAASSHGDDTFFTFGRMPAVMDTVAAVGVFQAVDRGVKIEVYPVFQFLVQLFQNDIINVGPKVAYGSVQKLQLVLKTDFLELGSGRGIHPGILSAVGCVDIIYIPH